MNAAVSIFSARASAAERGRRAMQVTPSIAEQYGSAPARPRILQALLVGFWGLFFASALSGCALYRTVEKCGVRGCPGDQAITAEVVSQLSRCSFLEPSAIRVQTLDRVVYLNGAVASGLEISAAGSIASQVPGAAEVINSIVVLNNR